MKVTQKDIASRLGVSTSLVSRVLSGQAHKIGVNPAKIEEILRVAKEMNYVPSPAALALRGKKSNTVGIVAYDFHSPYFSLLISELQELSHAKNYSLLLVGFLNRQPKESDLLPLYKHAVDGIIILGSYGDLSWTDAFKDLPIARVGHGTHPNLKLSIGVDERDAMRKIFHYIKKDLKKSTVAFAGRGLPAHKNRLRFASEMAKSMGFDMRILEPSNMDKDFESGSEIARNLLNSGKKLPEVIVCATDMIAMGIVKKFCENDVRIPEDVAIIGFDDIPEASNYNPSITSFRQPIKAYAKACFDAVTSDTPVSHSEKILEGDLLIRKSTL